MRALVVWLLLLAAVAPSAQARFDRWIPLRPAAMERTEVAAARVGGFVYVVGGFIPGTNATTAAVERYDIARNRWTRVRDMPVGLNHPAATAHGGFVYVVGGYTADGALAAETGAFLRYDPARDRWARMPPMPTPRAALAVGVIGDRLYAAGGATGAGAVLKRLEVFDFATRRWRRGADMAVPREHVAGAVSQGAFYVLGGRPGDLKVTERYVPARRAWERLPDMRTGRSGIAAATVGRRVVVFGGETTAGTIRPVEAFDPRTRRWSDLPGMRTPRHGLGGAALGQRVFALEGGPQPGFAFSRAIEALDVR
jgi:N-acetylneuraminic acid mutarotase